MTHALTEAQKRFRDLDVADLTPAEARRRGRKFEELIRLVLEEEGLEPTSSFRPDGEEVDGAFHLDHRTHPFEAKWRKNPIPASDLYAFKGKVDGKLVGTIGVVISISDYSDDAPDALVKGKELNLILFDRNDFRLIVDGTVPFATAMRKKLRYAAEQGRPYLPLKEEDIVRKPPGGGAAPSDGGPQPSAAGKLQGGPTIPRSYHFVVEGKTDQIAFESLLERLVLRNAVDFHFWIARGKLNVAPLALQLQNELPDRRVVAIVDEDLADAPVQPACARAATRLSCLSHLSAPQSGGMAADRLPAGRRPADSEPAGACESPRRGRQHRGPARRRSSLRRPDRGDHRRSRLRRRRLQALSISGRMGRSRMRLPVAAKMESIDCAEPQAAAPSAIAP